MPQELIELEMGVVGDRGVLQTKLDDLEILLWQHGKRKGEPRVIKTKAKRGIGWGGHLGFAEMHVAFIEAIQKKKQPITSVANTVDGTLLAIAAEQSIREKEVITIR